jgi:hypothetical protein
MDASPQGVFHTTDRGAKERVAELNHLDIPA